MSRAQAIGAVLSHRRLGVALALLAALLVLPALWTGLHSDDLAHALALRGEQAYPAQSASPMRLFSFVDGDPERNRRAVESGLLPWWSVQTLRFNFWRPLTALTHILDYRLWPDSPALMHAHSLVWFALLVASAATLYRRILGVTWLAGLAALLFTVDDAHAVAATWLASRNTLLSALFSILALIAHDHWRRDGWRPAALLAPLCLLLALLGGEGAVAAGGYLLAYALFLDRGTWRTRLASLLPAAVVGLGWYAAYVGLGYGTFGSGIYVDPVREPLRFIIALVERAPLQLLAQWAFPPTDWHVWFSSELAHSVWLAAILLTALLAVVLSPLLRIDHRARFFATGMLLALVPNCATVPNDRLLILVGLGASGLLAMLVGALVDREVNLSASRARHISARVLATVLIFIHGIVAPVLLPVRAANQRDRGTPTLVHALPNEPELEDTQLVMVNAPSALWGAFLHMVRRQHGLPVPQRVHVLATGIRRLEISRTGSHTLVIRPANGYFPPPRSSPRSENEPAPLVSWAYLLQRADVVFRGEGHPMRLGQRVQLPELAVEVTAVTADGRPAEATFHFDTSLNDASLLWLQATRAGCVPFDVPPLGQTVELAGFFEQGS